MRNLQRKADAASKMFDSLVREMNEAVSITKPERILKCADQHHFSLAKVVSINLTTRLPFEEWEMRVDQDSLPEWWNPEEARRACIDELPAWFERHVVIGGEQVVEKGQSRVCVDGTQTVNDGWGDAHENSTQTVNGGVGTAHENAKQIKTVKP